MGTLTETIEMNVNQEYLSKLKSAFRSQSPVCFPGLDKKEYLIVKMGVIMVEEGRYQCSLELLEVNKKLGHS